ncbi:regulatory protein, luxR family [Friedmanniella luteola]|uniref:Regulatory protein, luxR family n=1 Tax=Friedmanniella luteola TaxID=546871 RepID=A0A1H1ZIB8_9ACTN|nr:helix-turn-helix transcriptional regulator [Friedmanniella luteola]SDT33307.1 regulatory protein, luxR family [Friedmanniella luteola]
MPETSEQRTTDAGLRADVLARARAAYRAGDLLDAWADCLRLAALSREADDAAGLADAATVLRSTPDPVLNGRVHALAAEALARLGGRDPVRSARLRAQLVATADPFLREDPDADGDDGAPGADAEGAFLALQARHAELLGVAHLDERLALGRSGIALGRRTGVAEYALWGRRWRMDVHAVRGNRVDLLAELAAAARTAERLGSRTWTAHLQLTEAAQRLWDGRFDEAVARADAALQTSGGAGDVRHLHLVMVAAAAQLTGGPALDAATGAVADAVDGLPYFARAWLCSLLCAADRREEGAALWRSIAPHVQEMPERAPEWLIATVSHAEICVWLGDTATAAVLRDLLAPWSDLEASAYASTPYTGPVSYALGRLAVLLGEVEEGRRLLLDALARTERLHALPYLALTHAALARLDGAATRSGRAHAETGLRFARRLGMAPLVDELTALVEAAEPRAGRLSTREREVAALVAEGLSNATIAGRLGVSERTVESHVSHVLTKLDSRSRAAVAAWWTRQEPRRG